MYLEGNRDIAPDLSTICGNDSPVESRFPSEAEYLLRKARFMENAACSVVCSGPVRLVADRPGLSWHWTKAFFAAQSRHGFLIYFLRGGKKR
jgi:hypothetical protein